MSTKNCMIYETLGKVSDLQVQQGGGKNEVRLSGIFGVCGVKNNNKRVYNKQNYGMMVENLKHVIETEGCPGELEHPNNMNITLENVSHKIESIQMNEDGTITGTILLLNTPKGQIAKAIVEGGLPLYISSRGAGSIDENGNVTLSTIKTYDLVGTPGFSQAKLTLKENQTYESLNESLEDGNIMYAIIENDEFGKDPSKKESEESKDDKSKDDKSKDDKSKDDKSKDDKSKDDKSKDNENDNENISKKSKDINMEDLKKSIDELIEKVNSLEAEFHIAQESLSTLEENVDNNKVDYNAIEKWVVEEFAPEFKDDTISEMASMVQNWVVEEFAPEVQNWVCEEFAPEVQNWVVEEFAPEVQNWVVEEFAPEVQNWVVEEFAPEVQGWICEEFAPTVENWLTEEFAPENNAILESKINENINDFITYQNNNKFVAIDKMLESLENINSKDDAIKLLTEEQNKDTKFSGYYAIENMPAHYRVLWESLTDDRKIEIARQSKMYDFTKKGILESFWSSINFDNSKPVFEHKEINTTNINDHYSNIVSAMFKLRKNS